jgi:O-acetylhomoserine/O-acetylserine sulfhydrylase-like pyridoxal-dependent enzyme
VQSTIFNLGTSDEAEAIFSGARKGCAYSRFGNLSVDALAEMLAEIEGGAGALVTSWGNAAVLCAVTAGLEGRNGPLVTHHDIYGGSFELLRILSTIHRVPVEIVDSTNQKAWLEAQPVWNIRAAIAKRRSKIRVMARRVSAGVSRKQLERNKEAFFIGGKGNGD